MPRQPDSITSKLLSAKGNSSMTPPAEAGATARVRDIFAHHPNRTDKAQST